jgi:hypothetical protein
MAKVANLDIDLGGYFRLFHNGTMGNFLKNIIDLMVMVI